MAVSLADGIQIRNSGHQWYDFPTAVLKIAPIIAVLVAVPGLLHAPPALSAPRVQVRGHTTMRLMTLEQRGPTMVLTGELLDRDLRTGVPFRWVDVTARTGSRTHRMRLRTDKWGRFRLTLPGHVRGTVTVSGTFAGDGQYASQVLNPLPLDVSRQAMDLRLTMARELAVSRPAHKVTVRAAVAGSPVRVPIALLNGRGRVLAQVQTDAKGLATADLPTVRLGRPGPVTIQARFSGDAGANPVTRRFEALLISPVTLTLTAGADQVDADGEIRLDGTIADHGGPMAGAAVGIYTMGERAETAVSHRDGAFSVRLPVGAFAAGVLDLQARYAPDVSWRRAARSPAIEVQVLAPTPIPPYLYILPLLFTALVVAGLGLFSQRKRLARLLRSLRTTTEVEARDPTGRYEQVDSGVTLSRRSIRAMLSPDHRISGEVWDACDTRLIPDASVRLLPVKGATVELRTGLNGSFRSPALADGEYSVIVTKDGYVSERFAVTLPHRGSLQGIRVDLVQVRVRILELYRRAASPLLPRQALWACWTPRELLRDLGRRTGRRVQPLELLTRLLEMSYWGGVTPDEDTLHRAHLLAADLEELPGINR